MNYQKLLLSTISDRLSEGESIGQNLADILCISIDSAYRRYRGETPLTINEVAKISQHFGISIDTLFNPSGAYVNFYYKPLKNYKLALDNYLSGIHKYFTQISSQQMPHLTITINNTHFLQLLNFPHLARFKLHFWAKNHLRAAEFSEKKFKRTKFPDKAFQIGKEILAMYNGIPTVEIYDPEFLKGFAREIYFNYESRAFEDDHYALFLLEQLKKCISHIKRQCELGQKFIYGSGVPENGNQLDVYYNETLNAVTSFYYKTMQSEGLVMAHNYLNTLHTTDRIYVRDTKEILSYLCASSSQISRINEKDRNKFFEQIDMQVDAYILKIKNSVGQPLVLP